MDTNLVLGFAFMILGAICGGSFGLPSKFAPKDTPWETLWGPFFFMATILIPVTCGPLVADGLFATCSQASWAALAGPLIFGLLWGLGSMTLGLSFAFIGLSLAYALNYGAQIATGSMVPMMIHNPEDALTPHGYVIMLGVVFCLVGVVIVGRAGILKTRSMEAKAEADTDQDKKPGQPAILKGMLLAFFSGVLCACYAVGFSFSGEVMAISKTEFGNPDWRKAFVATTLILWGGSVSSCGYCAYMLTKNRTWNTLAKPGIGFVLLIAFGMACLHDGATLLYGLGALNLGALGVSVGYAVFMSLAIIVGNVNGFLTKEWKGASRQSVNWIVAGIIVLSIGVCVLGKGNAMKQESASKTTPPVEATK